MKRVPLDSLVFDDAVWPRVQVDEARVEHLADVHRAGKKLPALKVQKGTSLLLGGRHTVMALRRIGEPSHDVEFVDVPASQQLLYAYNEDVAAAKPYSDADVRSVARRLYEQRCTDGNVPVVTELAGDLGRSNRTVANWVEDLVAARERLIEVKRAARVVAVQAFAAVKVPTRQIATFVGIGETQVRRDCQLAMTAHLTDSEIVTEAHSLIHLAIGAGATVVQMEAARDWLTSQTDPDSLRHREYRRAWASIAADVRDWHEHVKATALPEKPPTWTDCEAARAEILDVIGPIETFIVQLKERVQ